jgi:RecA-family ATPase
VDATAVAGGPAWHGIPFPYRSGTALIYRLTEQAVYPRSPAEIIEHAFSTDRRVLLFVQPGIGKSTFARELAAALHEMGRSAWGTGMVKTGK